MPGKTTYTVRVSVVEDRSWKSVEPLTIREEVIGDYDSREVAHRIADACRGVDSLYRVLRDEWKKLTVDGGS
jgi:hypothetical protein